MNCVVQEKRFRSAINALVREKGLKVDIIRRFYERMLVPTSLYSSEILMWYE